MLSFEVLVLSRGKGVPPGARAALRSVREMIQRETRQGVVVNVEESRIGLEGETRLCIEVEDREVAHRILKKVRDLEKEVDLFRVVEKACGSQVPRPK